MEEYKQKVPFDIRITEAKRIRCKYPTRVPVIVFNQDKNIPTLDKNKYLVPNDLTMGQFIYIIRKRIKLKSEKALFIMTENGSLPPTSATMFELYTEYKSEDSFLWFKILGENTFG